MKLAYMVKPKLLYRGSLSSHGKCPEKHKCCCLAFFYLRNCHLRRTVWKMQTMDHKLIQGPELEKPFRILLAFSGLRQALTTNPGYNLRVAECQEAAKVLLTYVQIYLIHTFFIIAFFIFKFQWKCCEVYYTIACDTHSFASKPGLDFIFSSVHLGTASWNLPCAMVKTLLSLDLYLLFRYMS